VFPPRVHWIAPWVQSWTRRGNALPPRQNRFTRAVRSIAHAGTSIAARVHKVDPSAPVVTRGARRLARRANTISPWVKQRAPLPNAATPREDTSSPLPIAFPSRANAIARRVVRPTRAPHAPTKRKKVTRRWRKRSARDPNPMRHTKEEQWCPSGQRCFVNNQQRKEEPS
jgi:hypothetical protein